MKIFLVLPFLLALSGSSEESALSPKTSIRGLSTTLQTNFNGTYQRKNPCTNADVEKSSYVASHEFHHQVNNDNWSHYTQQCSAIINSFLQAIANLIQFSSKQNGTFNFHINTSISQKQDGHCMSYDEKQCNSLPTIIIEADGCGLPPPCKSFIDNNERNQTIAQEEKYLSNQENETVREGRQQSTKIISKGLATLKPVEKNISNVKNYSIAPQCPVKDESMLTPRQDASVNYSAHVVNEGLATEEKLQKGHKLISVNDRSADKNFVPIPRFSESSAQAGIAEAKNLKAFSNDFSQNVQTTNISEQNSKLFGTFPDELDFTTPILEDEFPSSREENQPDVFGLENPYEYLTSETPIIEQGSVEESSIKTSETQNFPSYLSPTVLEFERTRQPTFVNEKELLSDPYEPSWTRKEQIFDDMVEEIPDFKINKPLSNLQPSLTSPSTFESKFNQPEKPFNNQQYIPASLEKPTEPLKPFNFDRTSPSKRYQLAEIKTSSSSQASDSSKVRPPVSKTGKLPSQTQFDQIDKINATPYPTTLTNVKQNEKVLGMTDLKKFQNLIARARSDSTPAYSSEKETSDSFQSVQLKEYDESDMKPSEAENFFLSARKTKIPSQNSRFYDYNTDEASLLTPVVHDAIQLPLAPSLVSTDQISNAEVTFTPELNHENGILNSDPYYDDPSTDSFSQTEDNYQPFSPTLSPHGPANSITNSFSALTLGSPEKQNSNKNINKPVRILDQKPLMNPDVNSSVRIPDPHIIPPLDLKTSSYNDPVLPKMLSPDSLIGKSETEHQSDSFEISQRPSSNFGRTYVEDATSVPYHSSLKPKLYNNHSKLEFRENPPFPFSFNSGSLTTPSPNQIPPPPAFFSGIPDDQQVYNNHSVLDLNNFQSHSSVTDPTPINRQLSQRPNAQILSGNYMPSSPSNSFNNAAFMEQQSFPKVVPDKNLGLRYSDQIINIPTPTSYSEQIASDSYTAPDSSFSKPKAQSFSEINAFTTKEPVSSNEQFSNLPTQYSSQLHINDSPINPTEQPLLSPNVYLTPTPPSFTESSEEIADDFNSPFTEESPQSQEYSEGFSMYNSEYPEKAGRFKDVLTNGNPELRDDDDFLIESQSPFPFRNDVPLSREQIFSDSETDRDTEQESSYDNEEPYFQPINPSILRNPPTFSKSGGQTQTEILRPIIYPEASSQSLSKVYENQNNQPFFNPRREKQYFSANPVSLQKEKLSFTSESENLDTQNTEFIFPNEQKADSAVGFQQPRVNHMRKYQSGAADTKTDQFSSNKKVPDLQPESTSSLELEYQPTVKPIADPEKTGFFNFKNPVGDQHPRETYDLPLISNSEHYPDDFTLRTSDPSKLHTQSLLTNSNVQPEANLELESVISSGENNQATPSDSQPETNLPLWTDPPTDLTEFNSDYHPFQSTDPITENFSNDSPDFEFSQPPFSEAPNQQNTFSSPISSATDPKSLNQFPLIAPSTQSLSAIDYPSSLESPSQSQPPLNYYNDDISGQNEQPLLTTSVPRSQFKKVTQIMNLPKVPTSSPDSSPVQGTDVPLDYPEEAFTDEAPVPPITQSSSYLTSQEKLPNYSPFLAPSYDNFSDIPNDNIPLLASRSFDNLETTSQYPTTSSQDNLGTQGQSNEELSPSNLDISTLRYNPNRLPSGEFGIISKPLSVTGLPPFQTLPNSDLNQEELIAKSNENPQESTGAQDTLILADNVSPQPQSTNAVKYDEVTAQYQMSPVPNPQPQRTLNYANQLFNDNSNGKLPEFFTNQQRLPTSDPNFYSKVQSASSASFARQTPNSDISKKYFQSENEMIEKLSTKSPKNEIFGQTSEQEIITTDLPFEAPSQLPINNPNLNLRESFLPQNDRFPLQPAYQKPFSPKSLINPSTNAPQNPSKYFNDETFTSQLPNHEKEQAMDLPQIGQTKTLNTRYPESFMHYNEPSLMNPRVPDISNTGILPEAQSKLIPEDYPTQYDDYDSPNDGPQPLSPIPKVSSERTFYPDLSLDNRKKQPLTDSLLGPSPQREPLRFPQPVDTDFRFGFPLSIKSRHSFIPGRQLPNFPNAQRTELATESQATSSFNRQVPLQSLISSNNGKGTATTEASKEITATNLPIPVTESSAQKQFLTDNKKFQPLSGSVSENERKFEPSESSDAENKHKTFSQYSVNEPQQVEPFFEGDFPLNIPNDAMEDSENNKQYEDSPFLEKEYADYDQVFPNPPPNQKFEYSEDVSQDSQKVNLRHEPFDKKNTDVIEKQSNNFQERPFQRPVIYTPDREPSAYSPLGGEEQEQSNPLFQTLGSHMTLPFQEPLTSEMPNDSFSFRPNYQNNFRGNSPPSQERELPVSSLPQKLDIAKPQQPERQLVPDVTNPSNNPGEDHVSCCKPCDREATSSPLLCPIDTISKENMTAPSYYILISKLPIDENGNEQFQVEKVYLGDGTPLNCTFNSGKTFSTSLFTPLPFSGNRTINGRFNYMDRPLREPFYENRMRSVSTPERF